MRPQINDVFEWTTKGIFYYLDALTDAMPWEGTVTAANLDILYHAEHSGDKLCGPLIMKLMSNNALSEASKATIAAVIWSKFEVQWTKLWGLLTAQYNPIENYDMIETHTGTETGLKTPTGWKTTETQTPTDWTSTETQTPSDWTSTETQTPSEWKTSTSGDSEDNEATTASSVYGFNSSDPVPSGSQKTTAKNKSETEQTGTFETATEQTGTFETTTEQTGTYETKTEQSGTFEDKTTYNTTLSRHGNIGVQTASDMIGKELELWKWNFFDTVMNDIDSVIALSIY